MRALATLVVIAASELLASPAGAAASEWTGTIHAISTETVPGNQCGGKWKGTIDLEVSRKRKVTGEAVITPVTTPSCALGPVQVEPVERITTAVEGVLLKKRFELRFTEPQLIGLWEAGAHLFYYPGPPTIRVPLKSARRAATDLDLSNTGKEELAGGGGKATVTGTLKLRRL
jgi:hypothetical protein